MNYLITGVTGVVGSHILFELLNNKFNNLQTIDKIYVIIRKKEMFNAKQRLINILEHKDTPDYIKKLELSTILNSIEIIEADLTDYNNFSIPDTKLLIIHSAGSTNLSTDVNASIDVENNNLKATQNLICKIVDKKSTFVYISTAFSEGYLNNNKREFRNPYEEAKYNTEQSVIENCKKSNINWKILKPSIVCGRLIDPPLYFTPKFDVFYGWAKFFKTFKSNINKTFRIYVNKKSTLNIIPVDALSKKILFYSNDSVTTIKNLVNKESIPVEYQIKSVMNSLKITNFSIVDSLPEKLEKAEEIYYTSIGKIFEPYIINPIDLKSENCNLNIKYNVNEQMNELIQYAINKNFKQSY